MFSIGKSSISSNSSIKMGLILPWQKHATNYQKSQKKSDGSLPHRMYQMAKFNYQTKISSSWRGSRAICPNVPILLRAKIIEIRCRVSWGFLRSHQFLHACAHPHAHTYNIQYKYIYIYTHIYIYRNISIYKYIKAYRYGFSAKKRQKAQYFRGKKKQHDIYSRVPFGSLSPGTGAQSQSSLTQDQSVVSGM